MKGLVKLATGKAGKLFGRGKALLTMAIMAVVAVVAIPMSASAAPPAQDIDFGTDTFTFSLGDIMTSAWSFIANFNTYVILILALILVPVLIGFVIWLMRKLPKFGGKSA